jgi:hypothetical protein
MGHLVEIVHVKLADKGAEGVVFIESREHGFGE